jgi:hypothetical protein
MIRYVCSIYYFLKKINFKENEIGSHLETEGVAHVEIQEPLLVCGREHV